MHVLESDAIDRVLAETGYGFLGVAREDVPYVLPMSFGYDGALYFQMNGGGRKYDFFGDGTPACLTVLDYDPEQGRSTSVIAEGPLRPVDTDEEGIALDALASNAQFGTDLSVWGTPLQKVDTRLFVLEPETIAGRRFGEGVPHDQPTDDT
jgi:hypothetical protein